MSTYICSLNLVPHKYFRTTESQQLIEFTEGEGVTNRLTEEDDEEERWDVVKL